jgi:hypothetical protein
VLICVEYVRGHEDRRVRADSFVQSTAHRWFSLVLAAASTPIHVAAADRGGQDREGELQSAGLQVGIDRETGARRGPYGRARKHPCDGGAASAPRPR